MSPAKGQGDDKGFAAADIYERLTELGLFILEKAQGDPLHVYKYLMGAAKKMEPRTSTLVPSDRMRGNGHKGK